MTFTEKLSLSAQRLSYSIFDSNTKAILFQNRELKTGEVPVWKILITALETEQIKTDQQEQQTPL